MGVFEDNSFVEQIKNYLKDNSSLKKFTLQSLPFTMSSGGVQSVTLLRNIMDSLPANLERFNHKV